MRAQLILLLCALAIGASAQEDICMQEIDAAVSAQKSQTASLTAERDAFQAEVSECRDGYSKLYKTWQAQAEDVAALQASIADLKVKVSAAEEKLVKAPTGAPPKLDLPTIVTLLVEHAKDSAMSAVETGKAVFEELKVGKTDRLTSLLGRLLASLRGAASSTVAFVKAEAEEHLPDSVKKQISEAVAKAHAQWKQHVTDAAWAQPALKQLFSVNDELKKVVTKALSSHPVLASLADPVTVQLFAYSVFALPVLVLLVLPLALLGGKKPTTDARATPAKGKKQRGKARA